MRKVLLVIRGPIERALVSRWTEELSDERAEVAVCYELPSGQDGLHEGLSAQRELTTLLRQLFGTRAETVPVFTASSRDGDGVRDCENAWGATEVKA